MLAIAPASNERASARASGAPVIVLSPAHSISAAAHAISRHSAAGVCTVSPSEIVRKIQPTNHTNPTVNFSHTAVTIAYRREGAWIRPAEWVIERRSDYFAREEQDMIGTILSALIVGLIVGALARLIMPGKQNIGIIMTIVLGALGSFLGTWVTYSLGYSNSNGGFQFIPFLVGIIFAVILIAGYLGITGRRSTRTL